MTGKPTYKGFPRDLLAEDFGVQFKGDEVVIPYYRKDGGLWRNKVIKGDGKPRWEGKSKQQVPYGLETLDTEHSIVILTEGESCSWALRLQFPKIAVLGVPGANSWQSDWVRAIAGFVRVFISFDADPAGRELAKAVKADISGVRHIAFPEGFDTRSVLQADDMGLDYYVSALVTAEDWACSDNAVSQGDLDAWTEKRTRAFSDGLRALQRARIL